VLKEAKDSGGPDSHDEIGNAPPAHAMPATDMLYRVRTAPTPQWPGRLVDLPTGQLFVRTAPAASAGAGPAQPALFIHGLGGSATNWTDLMDLLSRPDDRDPAAPVLDCAAVDLPGFGFSPPGADGDYTINGHARAVIELLDKQGNWPVHLIGNSMGGAVSVRVAARRPDLVKSLTLISPALPDLRPRPLRMRFALVAVPGVGQAIMNWLARQPADIRTELSIKDVFNDPRDMHPDRRDEEIAELLRRDGLGYADKALISSARSLVIENFKSGLTSLWRDAVRTRAPALVVYGSHDKLVNPVMAAKAARVFRSGRVIVLPGVGHVAMMERPAVVAAEVRSFLDVNAADRARCA
jgi:pimeloyl-ACP methyl ester carboxylesterase